MLYPVVEAFQKLGLPKTKNDDFFDRLSRRYSMILIGVCFIIVTTTNFVGNPIHCYTQMVDSKHKVDYVNWVCWISSSYYLPFDKPLPDRNQVPPERIPYYQWVPFILFTMLMLFYVPGFLWRKLNRSCGIDTKVITKVMLEMDPLSDDKRKEGVTSLAKHIDRALTYHREYNHGFMYSTWKRLSCLFCCSVGRRSGNYLAFGYALIKLLYIVNAIGQLFLLNVFMGGRFHLYGLEILQKWFYSLPIEAVERFPRITMCKFILRTLGDNIQSYDVQCLLPNNIYNEKIFLLLWFWLAFVSIASIYGLVKWFHYFTLQSRKNFVRRFLKANGVDYYSDNTAHPDTEALGTFVDRYCRQDGILLLRIIAANTNNVLVGELICALWDNWQLQRKIRINTSSDHVENSKAKIFDDHDTSLSTLVPTKTGTLSIHDDRYILSPPRL